MADGREAKLGALYAPWDRHNQPFSAPRKHPKLRSQGQLELGVRCTSVTIQGARPFQ